MNKFSGMYIKGVNNRTHTSVFLDEDESQEFQNKYGGIKLLYEDARLFLKMESGS